MSQADPNEDLQEQIISLRELIEGYRESHRSLFRQVKEATAAQQQTEELFWSLVARAETRHHKHPTLPETDPFGELEELPPAPTTPSPPPPFDAERARRTEELETKVLQLMREVSRLRGANDELVWQMEAQEKTYQQAALAAAAALEHQLADARRERSDEMEQAHAAELAFQEQQYAHKSSELTRVSDKLRLVSVDLELAKCQIEEDAEEIANLQKKIKALQAEASQRPAARSMRGSASMQVPSALPNAARPPAAEASAPISQPLPQPAAPAARPSPVAAPQSPARLSPAAAEPASTRPASSRSATVPQGPPSMRPAPLHTAAKPPLPDDLELPLVQPASAHSWKFEEEDDDGEHVNEDELLIGTAPPPVAVPLPVASTAPASESRPRSARPPPLPSSSLPDLPASPPPPAAEGSRNRTQGWSSPLHDPFPAPVAAAKPSRNRTMLGFEANPDQLAKQRKLAEEASSDAGEKGSRSKR